MARPSVKDKLPNVKARPAWKWKADLLRETKAAAPHLEGIMNGLLFGKEKAEEADLVYRHLLLECGNNEKAAFQILFLCADALHQHGQTFSVPPGDARIALKVVENYRPRFEAQDATSDTQETFKAMIADLEQRARLAGETGRKSDKSPPQLRFIKHLAIILHGKGDRRLASLFKEIYHFTFGEKIHLADYQEYLIAAERRLVEAGRHPLAAEE